MQDESFIFNTPMGRKAINITPCDDGALVRIDHQIFGAWQFVLPLPFDSAVYGVTQMYRGELIQDAFPDLDAGTREQFITPPEMYEFGEEDDDGDA